MREIRSGQVIKGVRRRQTPVGFFPRSIRHIWLFYHQPGSPARVTPTANVASLGRFLFLPSCKQMYVKKLITRFALSFWHPHAPIPSSSSSRQAPACTIANA
jgi:hypothetical protein